MAALYPTMAAQNQALKKYGRDSTIQHYMATRSPNYVPNYINYRGGSGGVLPGQVADVNAFARGDSNEARRAALTPEAQGIYTTRGAYMRPSSSTLGSGGTTVASPTRFGDYAFTGQKYVGYTGSNPKAQLFYNQGVDPGLLDSYFGSNGTGSLASYFSGGTTPGSTGIPSGNSITAPATGAARGYANELAGLSDQYDLGRGLFTGPGYDAPSWGDADFKKESGIRRQYFADITNPIIRDLAGQVSRAGAIRGGYSLSGAGGPADALLGYYKTIAGNAGDRQQQIYQDITAEREARRAAAMRGFEDLLGGRQAAYSGYTSAAGSQAGAAAQDRANALAQAQLALQWYNATKSNIPTSAERLALDPYGYAGKAALQAQMDKEAEAQDLYRLYIQAGMGELQGNRITDAGRGQQFALQKQLEDALIAMGAATPVSRQQNMNQFLGGVQGMQVAGQPGPTGYGGQNIAETYYNPGYYY